MSVGGVVPLTAMYRRELLRVFSGGWARLGHRKPEFVAWVELERRFQELHQKELLATRLSSNGLVEVAQTPDSAERMQWYFMGSTKEVRDQAQVLFGLAGLTLEVSGITLSPRLEREGDPVDRWLWFLVESGGHPKDTVSASASGGKGLVERHSYWLREPVEESIATTVLCRSRQLGA